MFGGREGDGKKRIVNDIFIFDTGKYYPIKICDDREMHMDVT